MSKKHTTRAERTQRQQADAALTLTTQLTVDPPRELRGHKLAAELWAELLTLQAETKAAQDGEPIITAFDKKLLVIYCKLEEECIRNEERRTETEKNANDLWKQIAKMKPKGEEMKNYVNLLTQYNALSARVQGWDSRLDVKRGLLHKVAQSLYLTPRSRAGVAPPKKENEDDGDPMENELK